MCREQNILSTPETCLATWLSPLEEATLTRKHPQMVGPFQVPVADVGITATSLKVGMNTGEAMAMGGT